MSEPKIPHVTNNTFSQMSSQVHSPSLRLVQQFACDPDEHAVGKWRFKSRLGELVEHLRDSETVILPEVIQQAEGVVLQDGTHTHTHLI